MQKRIGERRRRDNMRRRARHRIGKAGVFMCARCGQYRLRQSLEAHHTNYKGYNGRFVLICKAHHRKQHYGVKHGKKTK